MKGQIFDILYSEADELQDNEAKLDAIEELLLQHKSPTVDKLVNFNFFMYNATRAHFRLVWGESLGDHFWNRLRSKGGFRSFMWNISENNMEILSKHLDKIDYREGDTRKQILQEFGVDLRELDQHSLV